MTPADVVIALKARGIELWQEGDVLRYRAPAGALTDREKAALKAHKASLLKALSQPTVTAGATPVEASLAVTEPLPSQTAPPEPGSTAPFGQRELDAIKAGAGCWVWAGVLNEWLFWVRDEERKTKAQEQGIDPAVIWTLAEITTIAPAR